MKIKKTEPGERCRLEEETLQAAWSLGKLTSFGGSERTVSQRLTLCSVREQLPQQVGKTSPLVLAVGTRCRGPDPHINQGEILDYSCFLHCVGTGGVEMVTLLTQSCPFLYIED